MNNNCSRNSPGTVIHTSSWTPLNLYAWPRENFCPCKRNNSINLNSWSNVDDEHPTKLWDFPKENYCMAKPENSSWGYVKLKNVH